MSNNMEMPARERLHHSLSVQTGDAADPAWKISRPATSRWPFTAQDISPLAWWRTLPSNLLRDAEHLLVIDTLDTICVMDRHDEVATALRGDPAVAVGVALSLLPIHEVTLTVDIAMTALLRCALGGDATAAIVVANLLHRIELDHPFATELSASWCTRAASHSREGAGRVLQNSDLNASLLLDMGDCHEEVGA
ncbi:hypothetical protein [Bradyrhizobium iriomotense]|uniref:hypothetical protein n=1 Tax=Bradyrhizobium iriomotense TaxID=441950 RepID=UPI001B89FC1C|nr:hypothetical protein [Bradyrhizobium iriomotense]MBR0781854.1 hypothetical protein [Bradyrhizobium iriomotense]